jgi:hypothetical protein
MARTGTRSPPEEINRFRGQFVAYSWDGTRIVGGASSEEALVRQLIEAGVDTQRVVFSYIDDL